MSMQRRVAALTVMLTMTAGWSANAATIAAQNFDDNGLASVTTSNVGFPSGTGLTADGTGLGWALGFIDSRSTGNAGPIFGTELSDTIGVVDNSVTANNDLTDAGNTGQWFHADDIDGTLQLLFDDVDASAFSNLSLGFEWAANDTSFEGDDRFEVFVNGTSVFDVSGSGLDSGPFVDDFAAVMLDLSAFDGGFVSIEVQFENSAGAEDLAFDNLVLSGDLVEVPLPASFLLLGAGVLALRLRRRIP
ncbi:MAG: PEP-CTERM sorting domain-containing protein [Pseudomonadota bacterium]